MLEVVLSAFESTQNLVNRRSRECPLKTSTVDEFMKEFGMNTQSGGSNVGIGTKPEEQIGRETRNGRRFGEKRDE